ncbi:hypothetical protein EVAR_3694_1 [Eumeta japonica]|uniref:Uncharacterized protein n=1 Tax=Eumeta variegata TaxID=151549 RepID=A0A4C1SU67_EUMVA|nr:hypothetical protein EVAR_3694_1 [Eumeta japonica]
MSSMLAISRIGDFSEVMKFLKGRIGNNQDGGHGNPELRTSASQIRCSEVDLKGNSNIECDESQPRAGQRRPSGPKAGNEPTNEHNIDSTTASGAGRGPLARGGGPPARRARRRRPRTSHHSKTTRFSFKSSWGVARRAWRTGGGRGARGAGAGRRDL